MTFIKLSRFVFTFFKSLLKINLTINRIFHQGSSSSSRCENVNLVNVSNLEWIFVIKPNYSSLKIKSSQRQEPVRNPKSIILTGKSAETYTGANNVRNFGSLGNDKLMTKQTLIKPVFHKSGKFHSFLKQNLELVKL